MFKYNVFITALLAAALTSCAPNRSTYAEVKATDGASCSVYATEGGSRITCPDGSTTLVRDGQNGQSCTVSSTGIVSCGSTNFQLTNGITILGYIYPCGKEFNNEEVFLRLSDGNILMVFDGGNYLSRLAFAVPMTYVTTDRTGAQCYVTVDNNLNVTTSPRPATGLTINHTTVQNN